MRDDNLIDCVRIINKEAGGVLSLYVVYPEDAPALLAKALTGDVDAGRLLTLVPNITKRIPRAPRRAPGLCGHCSTPIRSWFALAVVIPECNDPSQGLAVGLCRKCTADREDVYQKATEAMRGVWPTARPITVTHTAGGRA
jgi:hypothetical protein